MAGRFITTTTMKDIMPKINADNAKSLLNNPYYLFNNASASACTYYNLNTTMTTLDESTRGNYGEISPESPLRFNKINNFQIYGVNKIEPNMEVEEFGLEASDVTGDAMVLPKTIIPYPGDRFVLNQIDGKYLFKVTAVNPNTLDTGAVMYRINYTLESSDGFRSIEPQVVKVYNFSFSNYGSNFGCLIEEEIALQISELERYTAMLKDYFIQLFYDNKIQSFSYKRPSSLGIMGVTVYDPYLIEFLIRNNILDGSTEYMYVTQQVTLPNSFGIDYDRTIFSALEDKDIFKHYCKAAGNLELCTQRLSLLYAYPEDYYLMRYDAINSKLHVIDIFNDPKFVDNIRNNIEDTNVLKNLIVGYFNESEITGNMLEQFKHIDFMETPELFYLIPITIFILERYITTLLGG